MIDTSEGSLVAVHAVVDEQDVFNTIGSLKEKEPLAFEPHRQTS